MYDFNILGHIENLDEFIDEWYDVHVEAHKNGVPLASEYFASPDEELRYYQFKENENAES